jgi:hemerythrin superfamily protein
MDGPYKDMTELIVVLKIEHSVILEWADEIVADIRQSKDSGYIVAKITSFKEFLVNHILNEDLYLYPELPPSNEVDAEEEMHNMVSVELETFFDYEYEDMVGGIEKVVEKIRDRIIYEENLFEHFIDISS